MRTWLWLGAAALAVTLAAPAAQAQPRGSYQQSCTNVQATGGRDPELGAVCTDMHGRQQFSSLRTAGCVGDIGNNNGQLTCQGGRPGDLSQPSWNGGGSSGSNGDGHGVSQGGPGWSQGGQGWNGDGRGSNQGGPGWSQGGQSYPRGSYLQSCGDVQATGGRDPQLSATCTDMRGRQRFTSLFYARCVGDIGNINGQLTCQGGRPGNLRSGWDHDDGGAGWGDGRDNSGPHDPRH